MALTDYEKNIVQAFDDLCAKNGGASPAEVTKLLAERQQISLLDTVIDIEKLMRGLRDRGAL